MKASPVSSRSDCFHCGSPAPRPVRGDLAGQERAFCCRGCLGVARAIVEAAGIGWYERRESLPGVPPPPPEPLPADSTGWVVTDGDRCEATFSVDGLHCGSCVHLLERTVGQVPGVMSLRVLLGPRRARVVWDSRRLALADLAAGFGRLGFRAVPIDPASPADRALPDVWLRAGVAAVGAGLAMWLEDPLLVGSFSPAETGLAAYMRAADVLLAGSAAVFAGWPFLAGAWRGIRLLAPGMDLTIALGAVALFLLALVQAASGAGAPGFMMLDLYLALLLAGRAAEASVRARVLGEAGRLLRAAPARVRVPGESRLVAPEDVRAGDRFEVLPGERILLDGVIESGRSDIREAVLSGEPAPVQRGAGDRVIAGSHALDGRLVVRAAHDGGGTMAVLARLVEDASMQRTPLRRSADRAGTWGAVAMVVLAAAAAAVGGPHAGVAALLVFCPCALGLAVPAALACAGATGVKEGFLITDGEAFERLPDVDTVVLDKTGTVTEGELALVGVLPAAEGDPPPGILPAAHAEVLVLAAALAAGSDHPVARAIRRASEPLEIGPPADLRVEPGSGVEGMIAGTRYRLGRPEWVGTGPGPDSPGHIHAALGRDGEILACFILADQPDSGAAGAVRALRAAGLHAVLATGDRAAVAEGIARELGIPEVHADVDPERKVDLIRDLAVRGRRVAMVGDGLNDAPALAAAHVGVALGRGVDLARDAAGIVLLDGIAALPRALAAARRMRGIVRQNLAIAAAYNLIAVPAALAGLVSPPVAALLMPFSSLLVLGNALRLVRP